ncbi:tRNA-I(6)A37 thiotransferase enzyme MiaB [Radiomyces spectabilis]|uniref:tRNA-I(6)A37 thiotransferase enzyme MiaB n=1 Tax=Radiomyces spectabilis TaxID=64574 RepID=UPI00221E3CED|nr:tRNA-I(6)A37 thiotransferase enzyme MiaB [Radiomyces spectabilis]KAI8377496.1 tRNA-I(6)A37 thiotransferase enzyme MiaB [Radiomyces spectabilis]
MQRSRSVIKQGHTLIRPNITLCSRSLATAAAAVPSVAAKKRRQLVFDNRTPSLKDFLAQQYQSKEINRDLVRPDNIPYLTTHGPNWGAGRKFHIEVYGCQMNVNDTEILNAIMTESGYERTDRMEEADIIFLVTCAIRENAETRIWDRLKFLRHFRTKVNVDRPPLVGVLGCMAERLKAKMLEEDRLVDIVCGPDGYRSIPHLISLAKNEYHHGVANVMLSADETYADIMPMRLDNDNVSGWVSIMRGCNNMCSFCIVPFTRGNERSRPIDSIVDEVRYLSDQGVKEVTVLGQNVNSYRDTSESTYYQSQGNKGQELSNPGFKTIYKRKDGGRRFTELLDKISLINPEMRIRFTSPHPKDFPTDLLHLIASRPNLCNSIHMPIQSGSTSVLERMRRGYSREAYLRLVEEMRSIIPDVWISSDFIVGFCGETEAEHRDTVSLMEQVKYDMAFMFAYSMREKTHAHRRYIDDVPEADKARRLQEIVDTYHRCAAEKNQGLIRSRQLVLIDSERTKMKHGKETRISGRTDGGHKVFIAQDTVDESLGKGDFVEVQIDHVTSASLTGTLIGRSSISQFNR